MKSAALSLSLLVLALGIVLPEADRPSQDDAASPIVLAASDCEDCN